MQSHCRVQTETQLPVGVGDSPWRSQSLIDSTRMTQRGIASFSGGSAPAASAQKQTISGDYRVSAASVFDPLRPAASQSNMPNDVVISVPAQTTLEALPMSSAAVFLTTPDSRYIDANPALSSPFEQGAVISQNPFSVGNHYGMAQSVTTSGNGENNPQTAAQSTQGMLTMNSQPVMPNSQPIMANGDLQQHMMTNGFQQQAMLVIQQQQPIMIQQIPENNQGYPNVYASPWLQPSVVPQNQYMQGNLTVGHQASQHNVNNDQRAGNQHVRHQSSPDPFGSLITDPFEKLMNHPKK